MDTIPPFVLQDILFFKPDLNDLFSDIVNFVVLFGKYHNFFRASSTLKTK